ncbi:hypothetical protein SLEP1_g45467 [Rubroshorea leprosula]|uniref:Uncharacterized protein n=1 Tax=Rubroshorea leprosula TaxID=152421 RepID=A0AAV5LKV7_9ROSI|nr:hypothetical protein SLEP1_g45467 [Rubroshorea leprosula]
MGHCRTAHVGSVQLKSNYCWFDTVIFLLGLPSYSVGGKSVLAFGIVWWSIATVLTPVAAKIGLPFLLVRAFMGIGEVVAMPAMISILLKWVLVAERSRSLALVYSGMYCGSVTGLDFSPFLIQKFGWLSVFSPLVSGNSLVCCMAEQGWIADTLVSRGLSVTTVRKIMQTIEFLGPTFFLTELSHVDSPTMAVFCMACSQGTDAFSQSGLYSNHQDIAPRHSGVLLGLSNMAGVLAGVFGTAATGSWDDVFKVSVRLYLVGTVARNLLSTESLNPEIATFLTATTERCKTSHWRKKLFVWGEMGI